MFSGVGFNLQMKEDFKTQYQTEFWSCGLSWGEERALQAVQSSFISYGLLPLQVSPANRITQQRACGVN